MNTGATLNARTIQELAQIFIYSVIRRGDCQFSNVTDHTMNSMKLVIHHIHCTGQFTPKMKANAVPRLLSSLV